MTFGQAVKAARKARGMKQSDLGAAIGVSGGFISQVEADIRWVRHATFDKLVDLLRIVRRDGAWTVEGAP